MNNEKELFDNFCFLPDWTEVTPDPQVQEEETVQAVSSVTRKDLATLLAELEEINNRIEEIKAHKWHLDKLIKFHQEGFV